MREYLLTGYCISHIFMLLFIYHFTRRRYSIRRTFVILSIAAVLLMGLEVYRYFMIADSMVKPFFFLLQVVIVQGVTLLISRNRDARALFTGLTATNYALAGAVTGGMVHIWTGRLLPGLIVCLLIHVCLLTLANMYLRTGYLSVQAVPSKAWLKLCVIPILFYMSIFTCASWPVFLYDNPYNSLPALLFLITMFASYAVMIQLFHVSKEEARIAKSNEVLLSYSKVLEQEQKHVEEIKKEIMIERHDYQHHLRILLSLCEKNSMPEVREALREMLHQTEELKPSREYCKNVPLNGVFAHFVQEAERVGIQTRLNLDVQNRTRVSEIELAAAISNLLDNAVYACKQLEHSQERWLKIYARHAGGQILIEISNPCEKSTVQFDEESGIPVSNRGEGHGIGMQSVLAFARRNQAEFDCEIRENVFYARLLV